jgi:hypothetical protein
MDIKEKYFDRGLRELLSDEYTIVGTILGMLSVSFNLFNICIQQF